MTCDNRPGKSAGRYGGFPPRICLARLFWRPTFVGNFVGNFLGDCTVDKVSDKVSDKEARWRTRQEVTHPPWCSRFGPQTDYASRSHSSGCTPPPTSSGRCFAAPRSPEGCQTVAGASERSGDPRLKKQIVSAPRRGCQTARESQG